MSTDEPKPSPATGGELKHRHVSAGSNPHGYTIDQWLAPNAPAWVCNEVVRLREALAASEAELETWKAAHGDDPSLWPAWKRAAAARCMPDRETS